MENNNKPKVSILLSYYKGERFLETYLKNICDQNIIDDLELVFVGCLLSDKEKNIISQFESKINIKKIFLEELKKQSECWNIGIQNSTADFCAIWNIDDLRVDYSIENQYKTLSINPELDCTYGMFVISNQFGNKHGQLIDHSCYGHEEYKRSFLLGPFFMFRKSICDKMGYFDEQFSSGADFDFAIRLANNGKIKMIPYVDGYFLDEQKGLSTRGDNRQPIERTVVELRNNIHDKIDQRFVPAAKTYQIDKIKQFGNWINLKR